MTGIFGPVQIHKILDGLDFGLRFQRNPVVSKSKLCWTALPLLTNNPTAQNRTTLNRLVVFFLLLHLLGPYDECVSRPFTARPIFANSRVMGVGGKFWDLLKPYARHEGFDFLRNKRVAVDLSFWIVQHETAIKDHARSPHLRITFFRTINLFSKVQFLSVFVFSACFPRKCEKLKEKKRLGLWLFRYTNFGFREYESWFMLFDGVSLF